MDAAGRILDWNAAAQRTFGYPREEVLGRELAETIVPERFRQAHRDGLQRFLGTGEPAILGERTELSAMHRDGYEFPIEITISRTRAARRRERTGAGPARRPSTPSCTTSPNGA